MTIREIAIKLHSRLDLSPPVNLEQICNFFDWEIVALESWPFDGEDCSAIAMYYKGKYRIHLPKYFPKTRNNFSWAHEIGHIILGHFKTCDLSFINFRTVGRKTISILDSQANRFASELLMPIDFIKDNLCYGTDYLFKTCGVSQEAMQYRINNLKLSRRIETIHL